MHLRFKLSWLDDTDTRAHRTQQLETAIRVSASAADETSHTDDGHEDSGLATVDNFSDFSDQTAEQSNEHLEFLNDQDNAEPPSGS